MHLRKYKKEGYVAFPNKTMAVLKPIRWKTFMNNLGAFQRNVDQLDTEEGIQYSEHLDGSWYVSVMPGFNCVDIRQLRLPAERTT